MKWRKVGVIFQPDGTVPWALTHAAIPTPLLLSGKVLRIYISVRDKQGVGRASYVDVDAQDPSRVLDYAHKPVLDIGREGTFDDNGVAPTSVLNTGDGRILMYYVGFELCAKVRYRLFTGLAVSVDGGTRFQRVKRTPILERSDAELYFRCGPFVLLEGGIFRMWYIAGSEWTSVNGKDVPVYTLKYTESSDGVTWPVHGRSSLELDDPDEHGFGRPYVVKKKGFYQLYYSIRKRSVAGYRMGYAESPEGVNWTRKDEALGLDVSPSGWDSEAVMYGAVMDLNNTSFMFYNGNNFGETGVGIAVLEPERT